MGFYRTVLVAGCVLGLAMASFANAGELPANATGERAGVPVDKKIALAVLDFECTFPASPELGKQLSDAVAALLSVNSGIMLVDRSSVSKTLAEHELNLTGMVSGDQAIKIGNLLGAKLLVIGKAFPMGDNIVLTAKLVSTETSRMEAVLVKEKNTAKMDELAEKLTAKISEKITASGAAIIAQEKPDDKTLQNLVAALSAYSKKPVIAVAVAEEHKGKQPAKIDPAVDTEIKSLLIKCGFEVKDANPNALSEWNQWLEQREKNQGGVDAPSIGNADFIIIGKAISEYGTEMGALKTSVGRAEISLIRRDGNTVVLSESVTTRATDLGENIAAKTALQKAGNILGAKVLGYFAGQADKGQDKFAK